jgi:hypothetical protein
MSAASTDTFRLVALKSNRAEAHAHIETWAKAFGVTVDAIEENMTRLEVELTVTVTGDHGAIEGLRDELTTAGQPSHASLAAGPLSVVVDPILDLVGDVATARLKRWRRSREL